MSCRRGDVVLVRFPNSDLRTYKLRPALVVQADGLDTGLSQRMVALITSNTRRTGPSRVFVGQTTTLGRSMGLRTDSVVVADNIATVLDRELDRVIGSCSDTSGIDAALRRALAL